MFRSTTSAPAPPPKLKPTLPSQTSAPTLKKAASPPIETPKSPPYNTLRPTPNAISKEPVSSHKIDNGEVSICVFLFVYFQFIAHLKTEYKPSRRSSSSTSSRAIRSIEAQRVGKQTASSNIQTISTKRFACQQQNSTYTACSSIAQADSSCAASR
jgi:hypothetical protein